MSYHSFQKIVQDQQIEFIDFRFTDSVGRWQHITYTVEQVDENLLKDGIMFDGSSIVGWLSINESDMILMPDLTSMFVDPFTSLATLSVICDVIDPKTSKAYLRDPRSIAKKAEQYFLSSNIGNKVYFGPELEFFIFDDVRFNSSAYNSLIKITAESSPNSAAKKIKEGNYGHRPLSKDAYLRSQPVDSLHDIRSEMLVVLKSVGIIPLLHHHEVAPNQCELGMMFDSLTACADNVQKYKYVVHNVAHSYGKTATFMPKPIKGDNGSGMHVHQSIWQDKIPLFAGGDYAGLSQICLYYIGGIIKHAKALNAFTNPSTNSYKRLVPGYEAPVSLAYSACNRSASIRIPYSKSDAGKRIEVRFPDPTANPYLAFSAMLMAGIDGIINKIDPGEATEENIYHDESGKYPSVSASLEEALANLKNDCEFLKRGDVFTDDQIQAYIKIKQEEIDELATAPHPVEFKLYYSM
ncbi:3-hydroxylaminophenol mutase [Candidatus Arcanobacter lacustris]|uniref:Glutamine synthetase n=1 Tax=Candidatus Arcanibacter lacustris TaxID=1607817 RepID=A0A0F5MMY6_9RICK|nr:3-hydroxylaminophenol mutase [Candidatus Arcanobacter lacustris]